MEPETIKTMLDRYWLTETTLEEEKMLAEYFKQPVIPAELEPFRQVFAFFEEETRVKPGIDFEEKILTRINEYEEGRYKLEADQPEENHVDGKGSSTRRLYRGFRPYLAAASVILALCLIILYQGARRSDAGTGQGRKGSEMAGRPGKASPHPVVDTYEDPEQALAAIQKALLTVSKKMNQGETITQKRMDRLSNSLQAAITN